MTLFAWPGPGSHDCSNCGRPVKGDNEAVRGFVHVDGGKAACAPGRLAEMFSVTIHDRDGRQTFRKTFANRAAAELFRVSTPLLEGEVMTMAPEIPRGPSHNEIDGDGFDGDYMGPTLAQLNRARAIQMTLRPFVLINITGGVVESTYAYPGEGIPSVHTIDCDREEADADEIVEFAEEATDIIAEWQLYIDALTDEKQQADDQRDLLDLREEIDHLLDSAQGMTLIAGQLYDTETGKETNR